jgi:hypothetical protein
LARKDSFNRRIERQNLAIDAGFTNAAGDELSILGAEIKDYDNFVLRGWYQKEDLSGAWRVKPLESETINFGLYFRIRITQEATRDDIEDQQAISGGNVCPHSERNRNLLFAKTEIG